MPMCARGLTPIWLVGLLGLGCAQPNRRMEVGRPLEVSQGLCFVHTSYKQDGEKLNWDDTTRKLSRNERAAPYMSSGNAWAIGSIGAAVVATPALVVGSWGRQDIIDMDEDTSTALLVGGVVVGIGGLVMCAISDGQYAAGGEAYNEGLQADDRAFEDSTPAE